MSDRPSVFGCVSSKIVAIVGAISTVLKILNGGSFGFDVIFDSQKRSKSVITVPVHPVQNKRDDKENNRNNNQDDEFDPENCPAKSGPEIPLAGENRQDEDKQKEEHGDDAQ